MSASVKRIDEQRSQTF